MEDPGHYIAQTVNKRCGHDPDKRFGFSQMGLEPAASLDREWPKAETTGNPSPDRIAQRTYTLRTHIHQENDMLSDCLVQGT